MINKKLLYAQPDCELLVVRFEGEFLTGTNFGNNGTENGNQHEPTNEEWPGGGW